jgi:FtsZ-interacting cell division protein ZipA
MNPQWSSWAPVVSAGIVSLTSLVGIWLVQLWTSQREQKAKEREAKEKRANRWDDLQMKTLMDLQDTLKQLVTFPGKKLQAKDLDLHHGDFKETVLDFRQTANDMRDTGYHAHVLSARVPDRQTAELVSKLVDMAYKASHAKSTEEYKPFVNLLSDTFDAANLRIGELLAALRPDHP